MADYSLLDVSPEQRQAITAELLRRRQQSGALQEANARANQFNPLAAAAQMANNPELARAAQMAAQSAQSQYKPQSLGQMGYAIPSSGEFVPSPIYEEEKKAQRESKKELQADKLLAQRERDRERQEAQRERDAMMFENRRSLAMTLAAMRGAGTGEKVAAKAVAKQEKELNTNLQKFSATLEKAGVPEFESALEVAEKRLSQHKEGELPGYGRLKGYFPSALLSDDEQMSRADFQAAANILLKSRSGAAVTTPEERRFLAEVASGGGMSEAAMRHGWTNLRKNFNARKKNLLSSVSPEALEEYNARAGTAYQQGAETPPAAPPAPFQLPPGAKIISVREK